MIVSRFPRVRFLLPVALSSLLSLFVVACGSEGKAPATEGGGDSTGAASASDTGAAAAASATAEFQKAEPVVVPDAHYRFHVTPRVGDVFRYRMTQRNSKEVNGQKVSDENIYNFTATVTGINSDSSISLEMRYDSIRAQQTIAPGPLDSVGHSISYDTRQAPDSTKPGSEQIKALIGHRVNLTLNSRGGVSDVSNVDPILSALIGKRRDSISQQQLGYIRDGIKMQYFGMLFQELFLQFVPDTGVVAGGEWKRQDTMTLGPIPSQSMVTYQLKEVKRIDGQDVGRVEISLVASFPRKQIEGKDATAKLNDAKVNGQGEGLFNFSNGFPIRKRTSIEQVANMTMTATTGPQKGQSQTLAQKQTSSVLVELVEFKPGRGE